MFTSQLHAQGLCIQNPTAFTVVCLLLVALQRKKHTFISYNVSVGFKVERVEVSPSANQPACPMSHEPASQASSSECIKAFNTQDAVLLASPADYEY